MTRILLPLALLLALGGCAAPPRSHADAAQRVACQHRADEVFNTQNRDAVFRADTYATSGRDAPFGGGGYLNAPSLSDRYAREQLVDNCLSVRSGAPAGEPAAPSPTITDAPPP